jgi:hypothetical protein
MARSTLNQCPVVLTDEQRQKLLSSSKFAGSN